MPTNLANSIEQRTATFQSQGRLLQELGERLVARAEVALVELIKNSYDADSSHCTISIDVEGDMLTIEDSGHGMTEAEFLSNWMRIATGNKGKALESRKYGRPLTGEKGIGRFAVRFLGRHLVLTTVAYDQTKKSKTRLRAEFDWGKIDEAVDLKDIPILYTVLSVPHDESTGTILEIGLPRGSFSDIEDKFIHDSILQLVSPASGLDSGRFKPLGTQSDEDPGFEVILPPWRQDESDDDVEEFPASFAKLILSNYVGRVKINLENSKLSITASLAEWPEGTEEIVEDNVKHSIDSGFCADIRYFPHRTNVFRGKSFDGRTARSWISQNSGVAIIDRGLRIRPYGFGDDDWLQLSVDNSVNRRQWRSSYMKEKYMKETGKEQPDSNPSTNPMLLLPHTRQVVGAVFVASASGSGLVPASSREGYLENDSFKFMQEIVRAGLELLAHVDRKNQLRLLKIEAEAAAARAKQSFAFAIKEIQSSQTLSPADRNRIVTEYTRLTENLDEAKDYLKKASLNLDVMSLLGVLSGFITHESKRILHLLKRCTATLSRLSQKHPELQHDIQHLKSSLTEYEGHLEYTSTFVEAMHSDIIETQFLARPQLEEITNKFSRFTENRKIQTVLNISDDCKTSKTSITIYTGIILNLYTNAIKAVIDPETKSQNHQIEIRAWNDQKWHHVQVLDNGKGISGHIEDRIWDPLFTTTSQGYNPLGSGMGLGLNLVKKLMDAIGGSVKLTEAPEGFSTCFHLQFPQRQ